MAQILLKPGVAVAIFRQSCFLPESVVVGRAEDSAVVAEADLLDEALARVGLLQKVGQPPHVTVDLEPARGVDLVSLVARGVFSDLNHMVQWRFGIYTIFVIQIHGSRFRTFFSSSEGGCCCSAGCLRLGDGCGNWSGLEGPATGMPGHMNERDNSFLG